MGSGDHRAPATSAPVTPTPAAPPPAESAASAAPATSASPDARNTEFRAVEGGAEMQSGMALMTEAYAAIWLCVLGLVLAGMRKLSRLESRLDGLQVEIARARDAQTKKE